MGNAQLPAKSAYSSLVTKIWRLNLGSVLEGNPAVCTIILRYDPDRKIEQSASF
jgi:hypothetical protein